MTTHCQIATWKVEHQNLGGGGHTRHTRHTREWSIMNQIWVILNLEDVFVFTLFCKIYMIFMTILEELESLLCMILH